MHRLVFLLALFMTCFVSLPAEECTFAFFNDPIDVIIPCVEKDLLTLEHCIRGIRENGVNIRRIIVISDKHLTNEAEWFNESDYPFSFQDVGIALACGDMPLRGKLIQKGSRTGWYYQQLLKIYAHSVIPGISSNILILDSDVVFLRPVRFLNQHNAGMYNPGVENNIPYFQHAERLLPGFRKCFSEFSGISHHMLFQRSIVEALIHDVEQHHGRPFWQIFCELVDRKWVPYSGASEYEIYFNYAFSHCNQVEIRKLRWKNLLQWKVSQIANEIQRAKACSELEYICFHSYECRY